MSLHIFIVGDPTRIIGNPSDSGVYMVNWLEAALKPALFSLSGTVTALRADTDCGRFPSNKFMHAAGLSADTAGWARLQKLENLPAEATKIIDDMIHFDASLIVGWGIPPWLLRQLLKRKTPIINLELDPIRYGPDVRITADVYGDREAVFLSAIALDEASTALNAALFKAHYAIHPRLPFIDSSANIALFAGQTIVDLALVCDGKLASPADVVEDLREATRGYELTLITPHPLVIDWRLIDELAAQIPNAFPVIIPTYELLTHTAIKLVTATTSSVVSEAQSLGVAAKHFKESDVQAFSRKHRTDRLVLDQRLFHPAFWKAYAEGKKKPPIINMQPTVMPLRNSLGITTSGYATRLPELSKNSPLEFSLKGPTQLSPGLQWADAENWGRWSLGKVSTLVILIDMKDCSKPLLNIMLAAAFLENRPDLKVKITRMGNDPMSDEWAPKFDGERHLITFDLSLPREETNHLKTVYLRFDCSHPDYSTGYVRGLGIGVESISLSDSADQSSRLP